MKVILRWFSSLLHRKRDRAILDAKLAELYNWQVEQTKKRAAGAGR